MRPERSSILRSHLLASARSCVTMVKVAPRSRFKANMRSMMLAPVDSSRFPVGSSAAAWLPGDAVEIAHWLKFPNEPPRYKKNAGTDSDGYQHGEHGTNHRGLP